MSRHFQAPTRFRFGDVSEMIDEIERQERKATAHARATRDQLEKLMTPEAFSQWWNSAPDNDAEFLAALEAKLADELSAHDAQEREAERLAVLPETRTDLNRIIEAMEIYGLIEQQKARMGISTIEAAQLRLEKHLDSGRATILKYYTRRLQDEIRKEKGRRE